MEYMKIVESRVYCRGMSYFLCLGLLLFFFTLYALHLFHKKMRYATIKSRAVKILNLNTIQSIDLDLLRTQDPRDYSIILSIVNCWNTRHFVFLPFPFILIMRNCKHNHKPAKSIKLTISILHSFRLILSSIIISFI